MEIERVVMRQRRVFESGRTKEYAFRRTALLKLQARLRCYEKELVKALQKDLRRKARAAQHDPPARASARTSSSYTGSSARL